MQDVVDVTLSIDTPKIDVMKAGIDDVKGKSMINSIPAEQEKMATLFPLAAEHDSEIICMTMDEKFILGDVDKRRGTGGDACRKRLRVWDRCREALRRPGLSAGEYGARSSARGRRSGAANWFAHEPRVSAKDDRWPQQYLARYEEPAADRTNVFGDADRGWSFIGDHKHRRSRAARHDKDVRRASQQGRIRHRLFEGVAPNALTRAVGQFELSTSAVRLNQLLLKLK